MDLITIKANKVKAIWRFSVPAIISMILTSLITIVDGFFIGNYIGAEGVTAINLGLPIVYVYLGLGFMISVGGSVLASIALGASERDKCNAIFNQTMFTTVIITFAFSLVVWISFGPLLNMLNVSELIAMYFRRYYTIMLVGLPILVINNAYGMFIRGEGNPQFFMKVSLLNVIGNILLDYLFTRWLHLGIDGIAWASLLSSGFCLLYILYYFIKKSSVYKIRKFKFDMDTLKSTLLNGISEFIGEISMSITMFAYNLVIIRTVGADGVAAFTIVGYLAYIFSMIIIGFGQGISPLVSFTYGANEQALAKGIRKRTNLYVFCAGIIVIVLTFIFADWYSGFFVKNQTVTTMIESGIIIFTLSFLFTGFNTITSFYFTSIGMAKESAIISGSRGLVILLICIFTLPALFGMTGVWLVAPITEIITLPISLCMILKNDKRSVYATS